MIYLWIGNRRKMTDLKDKIKALAKSYHQEFIMVRQHLHQHPELSMEEHETSKFVKRILREIGVEGIRNMAGTGVVATLVGKLEGEKVVALRADMDALPISEQNDIPYKSAREGVMHACGHDVHMASLLGCAKILYQLKEYFGGKVIFIFQPSEETYPGGARLMIEEGVLNNPRPDVIIGQHVYPDLDAGAIGLKAGKYMASTDEFFITVKGRGGHAATPDKLIDPILIASHIVIALQQIVSRNARPFMPTVISVGKMIANGRTNVIPDKVELEGIIRTYDDVWREEVKKRIRAVASSVAEGMGGSCEIKINAGYPALENEPAVTERIRSNARDYLGQDKVYELEPRMTAEDFAYYLKEVPGCFYRLGIRNEARGITSNLHTSTFNVDEESLETGMGLLAWLAVNELTLR